MGIGKGSGFGSSSGGGGGSGEAYLKDGYVVMSGSGVYTGTTSEGLNEYEVGQTFRLMFQTTNSGGTYTVNLDTLGPLTMKKATNISLAASDVLANTVYTATIISATEIMLDIGVAGKTFDWVPVFTGYSSDPTVVLAKYRIIDNRVDFKLQLTFNSGTSNATSVTFTGPAVATVAGQSGPMERIVNGGVSQASLGMWLTQASSAVLVGYLTGANTSNTGWTASVGKSFNAEGSYYIS